MLLVKENDHELEDVDSQESNQILDNWERCTDVEEFEEVLEELEETQDGDRVRDVENAEGQGEERSQKEPSKGDLELYRPF